MRGKSLIAAAVALPALAGCAVGPDFAPPKAPSVEGYTKDSLPAETSSTEAPGGAAQRFVRDLDIPGQWWTLFRCEPLNALVERALAANPTLEAAQASLRQAWENVYAQQGFYYPTVTGGPSTSRNKTATGALSPASASGNPYYTLNTLQLSVSYAPDVFGLNRRTVESLEAEAQVQRFQLEATYLTLTSDVVAAAIEEASLRGQIAATQQVIDLETQTVELFRRQFTLGQIAEADVIAQEAALAQAQATLPPLQKALAQQRDLLTALVGRLPSEEPAETFELSSLQLPQDVPVSLPSKLVEQRPDIRSAEEQLHAASAEIGVATANLLPSLTLTGNLGNAANDFDRMFTTGTGFWSIAAGLTQPLFDGGTLLHKRRGAEDAFDQAAAQYRSTVIGAFQNVADSLRALQYDADAFKAAENSERAASASLEIARRQLQLGQISYLAVLTAEQTYQQAVLTRVQAQANRYADTAALFQSLGGGWWNRTDVADAHMRGGQ